MKPYKPENEIRRFDIKEDEPYEIAKDEDIDWDVNHFPWKLDSRLK